MWVAKKKKQDLPHQYGKNTATKLLLQKYIKYYVRTFYIHCGIVMVSILLVVRVLELQYLYLVRDYEKLIGICVTCGEMVGCFIGQYIS